MQTLELLIVRLEELQILRLKEVETIAIQMQTLREREGILDRQTHIWHTQLSLDSTINKLNGTMHNALRMDKHLYLISRNPEEPFSFCHLEALVHERSRIDGYLGAHIPGRMLEGIGSSHLLQLLVGIIAERTARTGQKNLLHLVVALTHQTLEDGTMLAVNREDRHMIFLCKIADQLTRYHQRFLVGKTYLLTRLDGMDGWFQAREAYHGSQHHIDRLSLYDIAKRLSTGINLDIRLITEHILQLLVASLIGYDHSSRMELASLLGKFLHSVVGGEAIYLVKVTVLLDDIKRLCTDTSRRTENTYLLFLHLL